MASIDAEPIRGDVVSTVPTTAVGNLAAVVYVDVSTFNIDAGADCAAPLSVRLFDDDQMMMPAASLHQGVAAVYQVEILGRGLNALAVDFDRSRGDHAASV